MAKLKYSVNIKSTQENTLDKLKIKLMSSGDFTIVTKGILDVKDGLNSDLIVLNVTRVNRDLLDYLNKFNESAEILGEDYLPEICILDTNNLVKQELVRSPYISLENCFILDSIDEIVDFIRRRFVERMF